MDNVTANKSLIPCQSWVGQNGWPTTSAHGALVNSLPSSQHLSLGSASNQRPSYDHMQAPHQSCMSDPHSALYKNPHNSSNTSSAPLFSLSAIQSAPHIISFAQQTPPMQLNANQGNHVAPPSLPQSNRHPQPCRPQHMPLLSPHDPYKSPFQPPLNGQGLTNGLQGLPVSLPSCAQRLNASEASFQGANVEFAGAAGYTHSHAASTSQEQLQWIPSAHCRGEVNVSVSETAAHLNKEPSQEGNNNPAASTGEWRSVLLQQRAQLLQQLAKLDTFLEQLPPDESGNGEFPNTARFQPPPQMDDSSQSVQNQTSDLQQIQPSAGKSKSEVSEDCSPPASPGEHSDTCDSPEGPMLDAESVKKENMSAESGEGSDPDYSPNSDGDSDAQSDHAGGSADESSPSSPIDQKPPLPPKKRTESESSLSEEESVIPPPKKKTKKKPSEAVVLSCLHFQAQKRVYDRKHYCPFCSKPYRKLSRHLEHLHSDNPEVAVVFQYPVKSRERQKIWNRLRNQGNFAHNKDVLKKGKGNLNAAKRPFHTQQANEFLHCLHCKGLYQKNSLPRHMRSCPERVKSEEIQFGHRRTALLCALQTRDDLDVTDGFRSVLLKMINNDVTHAIIDDKVILQLGELLLVNYGSDEKNQDYIRQQLRHIARLVLEAQKITPLETLEDFFLPSNFPHVVSAVNVVAGYDPEKKTYSTPSLAIKLGYILQKACGIVEDNAVKSGDKSLAKSARNFMSLYRKKWNKLISSSALATIRKTKQKEAKTVPLAQDVKQLNSHLENVHPLAEKKLRGNPSPENYVALVAAIVCRMIFFNRRFPGEVARVLLTDFQARKKSSSLLGMDASISDLEKKMCEVFTRIDIRGKNGRMVPVFLKPSFVSTLELLVEIREKCGVPGQNPFLFGRPLALGAYRGSDCLRKQVKLCGFKNPEVLTSQKIRKNYMTMLQLINLDDDEANQILGPNNQVRTLRQDGDVQLDEVLMDCDRRLQAARGQQDASWDHSKNSSARYGPNNVYHQKAHGAAAGAKRNGHRKSVSSGKKDSQDNGKRSWDDDEVLAVERHMMSLIKGHKVPQKNDCVQCLEAEPEALSTRTWKGLKNYVRNRITALKRQSGTSKAK